MARPHGPIPPQPFRLAGSSSPAHGGSYLGAKSNNLFGRSDPRPGKTADARESDDKAKYQFWPEAIAMGSLTHRTFTQILGAGCVKGVNTRSKEGHGLSHIAFEFRRECLAIRAVLQLPHDQLPKALAPLDAELSFDDITSQGIFITHLQQGLTYQVTVTVSCKRPPKFYAPVDNASPYAPTKGRQPTRRRATAMDFAITGVPERDAGPLNAIPEGPCAFPTFWNTYRWVFRMSKAEYDKLKACTQKIRMLAESDPNLELMADLKEDTRWQVKQISGAEYKKLYDPPDLSQIRFSARTLIEGLIAHGNVRPVDVRALLAALQKNAVVPVFQDRILEDLYKRGRIRDVAIVVENTAKFLRRKAPPLLSKLVLIRTVLVTPTRVLVGAPQQEPQNSVTREYKDKLDGIIRVQFADEEDRLFMDFDTKESDKIDQGKGIPARLRRTLQHGLVIGGQTFLPVASSASQQKEHAIWFINNQIIDGLHLRRWMGDIAETVVAKHAARMGLPFSTSREVEMNISIGPKLDDVERNGRTFTDGVAMAGKEVLKQAALALGEKKGLNATPSAIQFRLGGAKGVLADWPKLCKTNEVRLRPSNIKFSSTLRHLNAVRIAKYQVAFLNRQFVNIMCANGVPTELMIEIFRDAVSSIKGLRGRVRDNRMTPEDHQLIALCSDFPLAQLIKAGFHRNPLMLDIAEVIECRALQDLKWRARVKLPGGVFLIGIADESGMLKENEVFCQFQENEDTPPRVVLGDVIICRAPALHPGDVRRVKAADYPELRHLKNVIVFSVQGERDLPSMLGGGDLDGDDYTLIWDPRFVRTLRVYEPMSYEAPNPIRVSKVTQSHLNENFVSYILNDVLGQVDNCHLALCDKYNPFHEWCLELSEIHSTAVDFAKTGIPAPLKPFMKLKEWPDFMDKDDNRVTYASDKVLGQLFRLVQPDPHFSPSDITRMNYPTEQKITQHPVYNAVLQRLRPVKAHYENMISDDMRRYRVYETEIPSGIAIKNKRRKRARDQNLNEPLRDSYSIRVAEARAMAMEAVSSIEFKTRLTPAQVVARHCYALTFEREYVEAWLKELANGDWHGEEPDEDSAGELKPRPLLSFAFCFWQELIQIAGMPAA